MHLHRSTKVPHSQSGENDHPRKVYHVSWLTRLARSNDELDRLVTGGPYLLRLTSDDTLPRISPSSIALAIPSGCRVPCTAPEIPARID